MGEYSMTGAMAAVALAVVITVVRWAFTRLSAAQDREMRMLEMVSGLQTELRAMQGVVNGLDGRIAARLDRHDDLLRKLSTDMHDEVSRLAVELSSVRATLQAHLATHGGDHG